MLPPESRLRIVIEDVYPQLDCGRFAVKRIEGERIGIWADIFMDGHDRLKAAVLLSPPQQEIPLTHLGNDRWHAELPPLAAGRYRYTIHARPDHFGSWQHATRKKHDAGQDIALELTEIGLWLDTIASGLKGAMKQKFIKLRPGAKHENAAQILLSDGFAESLAPFTPRDGLVTYDRELEIKVERRRAEFSAWYEMFPRSQGQTPGKSGRFADAVKRLPDIRAMGFDVIYLPPIHPIGKTHRKGKNNALAVQANDPGSPYAIGSEEGGHKAVHPELGTLEDFRRFVKAARKLEMEVALDFAVQCSPDHPYIKEHPDWFTFRPDGSIQYAENPPKKYQDIVNVNFASEAAPALWEELRSIVAFWLEQGVTIFRVDNPHTKPFAFWRWLIESVQDTHPDSIFLSESFTRPKIMYHLAKLGFTQSYSYFTWRNSKQELTEYLTELTTGWPKEYFRPNFFPVTPDIFPGYLHHSGPAGFIIRLALAATLGSNYGMLAGYELCEGVALPGSEEYADSEKYEIKPRDWNAPGNIKPFVTRLNRIRQENSALQQFKLLAFYPASNDQILFYGKWSQDRRNAVFIAVNLDYAQAQEAFIELPLAAFGIAPDSEYTLDDLLLGHSWQWRGARQHLRLDPAQNPVAIFRLAL